MGLKSFFYAGVFQTGLQMTFQHKEIQFMKRKMSVSMLVVLFTLVWVAFAQAEGHGHKKAVKKGILLVTFGSSMSEAQVSFQNIEKKVKTAFPGIPVRWAYTSDIIRHKLARKEGRQLDSVKMALAKMADEDFTHVAVQSLHTIGGEEYHDLLKTVHGFKSMGAFQKLITGYPLLATEKDLARVADAMIRNIPPNRLKKEAVIYMGHGTPHPGNAFYPAMLYYFQQKDPNIFVGTVEGTPGIDDVKTFLLKNHFKTAYLIPFMSVAGDHARNDMAGPEEDSWKSILTQAGIECKTVLKGSAEYDDIVDVWVDHLDTAFQHL
jgi:sirohydrochlorin cobaltochelatase